MRFRRHIEIKKGLIDIAPLIDTVFLLLIFFMLTSNFISQQAIKVNLPSASSGRPAAVRGLVIFITDSDRLAVDGEKISAEELASRIAAAAKKKSGILINADKKASLGKVVEVWDLCRESGVANISIATVPGNE